MKAILGRILVVMITVASIDGLGQPLFQSNKLLSVSGYIVSAAADGFGQHVLTATGTTYTHYLLGNDGAIISSNSGNVTIHRVNTDVGVSITSRNGFVTVVADSFHRLIVLRSSNGGESWTRAITLDLEVETNQLDSYADANGAIHIAWTDGDQFFGDKVYYIRYDPSINDFDLFKDITEDVDGGGGTIYRPKVLATPSKAIVSFVRTDPSHDLAGTRTLNFSDEEWESSYKEVPSLDISMQQQSICFRSDTIHIGIRTGGGSEHREFHASARTISGNWTSLVRPTTNEGGDETDFRRTLVAVGDSCFGLFGELVSGTSYMKFFKYTPASAWTSTAIISSPTSTRSWIRETIAASAAGVYAFYTSDELTPLKYMTRRVFALSGNIVENMFWTDSNWVSDDIHIQSGKTVTVKGNSTTFLAANKTIYVEPGGTLVCENNTNLTLASGSAIVVKSPSGGNPGGKLRLANSKVLTIPSGASLEAQAGSQFEFGTSARIDIDGQITVSGSSGSHVTFALAGGASGTWAGIKVQGYPSSTITWADFSDVSTGVQLLDADSPNSRSVTYSTFTDVTGTGILLNSISNVTITDNVLTASGSNAVGIACITASPSGVLRNTLEDFKYGLYCTDGSSPVLENGVSGGNNVIYNGETGVQCEGSSDAILGYVSGALGDEGGQNSIYDNSSYDVYLVESDVLAENNWWGSRDDPPGSFSVDGSSSLDYDPWLEEDPNPKSSLIGAPAKKMLEKKASNTVAGSRNPSASLESELVTQALDQRTNGEYEDAASTLKSIISSETETSAAKGWAIRQLLAVSQCMDEPALVAYLGNLGQTNRALTRDIDGVLPAAKLYEGSRSNAMAAYSDNAENYPETWLERAAVYQLFLHALYHDRNTETASTLSSRLSSSYPGSVEASLAGTQLSDAGGGTSPGAMVAGARKKAGLTGSTASVGDVPTAFALAQNYPNPFNPSTTIRFDIPIESHVTLKVFDVLGKEVITLLDEPTPAGLHRVSFDARGVPSGMYFYRLTAGSFSDVRKLVLLK